MFPGAGVDHRDGYVGCMRGLIVNGKLMDMRGKVERGEVTYGLTPGMLTLTMLRLLSSNAQERKYFENHLIPVMLVFIGKLSLSTLR